MPGGHVRMCACVWEVGLRQKPNKDQKLLSWCRPDYRGHTLIHKAADATVWNNNNSRLDSSLAVLVFMHIRYTPWFVDR